MAVAGPTAGVGLARTTRLDSKRAVWSKRPRPMQQHSAVSFDAISAVGFGPIECLIGRSQQIGGVCAGTARRSAPAARGHACALGSDWWTRTGSACACSGRRACLARPSHALHRHGSAAPRMRLRGRRRRGLASAVHWRASRAPGDRPRLRATDSSGVIETLLARKLIEDDPRFGSRGRPSFLATTDDFLRSLGLGSLADLPPLPSPSTAQ
jgi:hypothetical protein